MAKFRSNREAFGPPGIEPRCTYGNEDGVRTAYAISSRVWFTLVDGVLTEVYYSTVDRPQLRDRQFLVTDGSSFFHEERRHLRDADCTAFAGCPQQRRHTPRLRDATARRVRRVAIEEL